MKMKTLLLAGIAFGALASTGANAVTLLDAEVSNATLAVSNGVIAAPYGIPAGLVGVATATPSPTLTVAAANVITVRADNTGNIIPSSTNTYELSFKLTGTANPVYIARTLGTDGGVISVKNLTIRGFGNTSGTGTTTATSIVGDGRAVYTFGTCTLTDLVLNTGAVGQDRIAYRFKIDGTTCDAASNIGSFSLDVPFQATAVGTVVLTSNLQIQTLNINADPTGPATTTLVTPVANFSDIGIGANPFANNTITNGVYVGFNAGPQLPTAWAAAGATGFNAFTNYATSAGTDLIIGSVKASAVLPASLGVQGLYGNLAAGALPSWNASLAVTATSSPVFNAMRPGIAARAGAVAVATTAATVNSANTIATVVAGPFAPAAATGLGGDIIVAANANNNVSVTTPQSYTATLTVTPSGTTLPAFPAVSSNLETTTIQGFRIDAPWFGGSKASTPSLVRLSNSASAATGTVSLVLKNPVLASGDTLTKSTCSIAAGVPATGELLLNTAQVTDCFGNFIRGDLEITVQGAVQNLTAKMRVLSSNGSVSEQTLGNVAASTAVVN